MNKTLLAFMALAIAFMAVSCQSEEELAQEPTSEPTNGSVTTTGEAAAAEYFDNVRWIQLWEGGPKFAEYNVGATSVTDYGGYYCWGKSIDKDPSGAYKSGSYALTGNMDTATKLWGIKWRMPTQAELQALCDKCYTEWTTVDGVRGRKFTGKADPYKSNSVFLPAAGRCSLGNVSGQGNLGIYWSSTPDGSFNAYDLYFNLGYQIVHYSGRDDGYSVRAVLAE